jgi:23S rRNA (cytidine1920-2'-O)/16S rRNA (cytidine1409-2'-O)-methyltransferase
VRRGLAGSRAEAQEAVRAGHVTVRGTPATKSTTLVGMDEAVVVGEAARPFVSRAGQKLAAALDAFSIDPAGRDCLDAGASTGGFTDCMLQRRARHVVALDVGYGQLAWELRTDPRVTILEKTNVRDLERGLLPYRPSLLTTDLSFISLRLAMDPLIRVAQPAADLVLLIKPQFEARRDRVGRGGVVRDPDTWRSAIEGVVEGTRAAGAGGAGLIVSPVMGPAGNVEFLLHARVGEDASTLDVDGALEAAGKLAMR